MSRNKLKRYTGAEVAQQKSIAEQLLEGTKIGNLLYGKQKTYKDGYNRERKDASFKESANGQIVQRMGETAKGAGNLVATGLAFGNPLTAGTYMAPLITGSQAYWIGHGIKDGAQRIENIGEGVQNFVEDPSWQNAGAVVNEVPMLALDVASALPVARTVIKTGKNAIPVAQQAAQRIAGSVDDAITTATKQAVENGVVGVNELPAQLAARATFTPKVQEPLLNVGWAPASKEQWLHHSNEAVPQFSPIFRRWDVQHHNAEPRGIFFTKDLGNGMMQDRPYHHLYEIELKKPMVQVREVTGSTKNGARNNLIRQARQMGADGYIMDGIADNKLLGQKILFNMPDIIDGNFVSNYKQTDIFDFDKYYPRIYNSIRTHPIRKTTVKIDKHPLNPNKKRITVTTKNELGDDLGYMIADEFDKNDFVPDFINNLSNGKAFHVGEDLYDGAVIGANSIGMGIRSSDNLVSPIKTRSTLRHYMDAGNLDIIGNTGISQNVPHGIKQPVFRITKPLWGTSNINVENTLNN